MDERETINMQRKAEGRIRFKVSFRIFRRIFRLGEIAVERVSSVFKLDLITSISHIFIYARDLGL